MPGPDDGGLVEELRRQDREAARHLDADDHVQQLDGAARDRVPGNAEADDVAEEVGAGQQAEQPDEHVAGGAHPVGGLKQRVRLEPLDRRVVGAEVDDVEGAGQDDTALEPAARRELAVRDRLDAGQQQQRAEEHRQQPHRRARRRDRPVRRLVLGQLPGLVAQRPEQHRDPGHGAEQDEFLKEGVDAAVVEADGRHHVGDVTLPGRQLVQHSGVGGELAAERRQAGQADAQGRGQRGRRHREEHQAGAAAHSRSFRTLARLSSTISGSAIAPTTICDSATSPACSDR